MRYQMYAAVVAWLFAASSFVSAQPVEVAPGVLKVGEIQNPDIQESSGIIQARAPRGVFWTHNDSGLDVIYAIQSDGTSLGQWKIKDVDLENIEDIASSGGRIFVADIGNNDNSREMVSVYSLPSPPVKRSGEVRPNGVWHLTYPGDPFDSESFFVLRNKGYLISKELSGGEARVYCFPLGNRRGKPIELQKLAKLNVNDTTRGADVTPDGKRLAVITGSGAYLFNINRTIPADGILEPALKVDFDHGSMEGCCFIRDGLMVTSESRDLYLFTADEFKYPAPRKAARR